MNRMTPDQFREVRASLALSTNQLSEYLGKVTYRSQRADTIRKWESGASTIPYAVPADLRLVIEKRITEHRELLEALNDDFNIIYTTDTVIDSPRHIANGRGAWQGTLGELVDNVMGEDSSMEGQIIDEMIARGQISEETADDSRLDDLIQHITLDDIKSMTDDPNAKVG